METIASASGTLGGKHRSSQFLASVRCLSAVLQKVRSSPASGRHAPSLPGCCPQVTHTASSALSGAHPPGWRCTFPSRPPRLSPQPGRFWGPGSPAPWRPWLVRHGVEGWGMRQGPRLGCCPCFWLTPPRPPHLAFGWTSPICAPSGEGLQVLPGLALESQDQG